MCCPQFALKQFYQTKQSDLACVLVCDGIICWLEISLFLYLLNHAVQLFERVNFVNYVNIKIVHNPGISQVYHIQRLTCKKVRSVINNRPGGISGV